MEQCPPRAIRMTDGLEQRVADGEGHSHSIEQTPNAFGTMGSDDCDIDAKVRSERVRELRQCRVLDRTRHFWVSTLTTGRLVETHCACGRCASEDDEGKRVSNFLQMMGIV